MGVGNYFYSNYEEEVSTMYFITFTRKMGTGGSEIARRVAAELGYNFYDTEALENAAREMGFMKDATEVEEKAPSLFERFFSSKELEIHLDRLNSVIYELASIGNAVFLGRGSHVLLRTLKCALHVRITASEKTRIHNLGTRGLHEEVALKAMRRSDHEREAFTKFAFGVNWDNPELYDIVLNMDNLTVDLAIDTVLHIARSEEIKARSVDVMTSLGNKALETRAEAALIEAGFSMARLFLSVPEPGKVRLTGFVRTQSDVLKAGNILQGVKGVKFVDNQVNIATPPDIPWPSQTRGIY
jgi:cytidylate kinase